MREVVEEEERLLENAETLHGDTVGAIVAAGEVFFEVDKLTAVRRRGAKQQYLVKWKGYEGHEYEYTWEAAKDVHHEYIELFQAEQLRAKKKRKREQTMLGTPHTIAVAGGAPRELQEQRRDDADWIEEDMARAAVKFMKKQSTVSTKARLICTRAISESAYLALHARCRAAAETHVTNEQPTTVVEAIKAKAGSRGGAKVIDQFRILNEKVVDEMMKPYAKGERASGALYMREKTLGAVAVPPFSFRFEMKEEERRVRLFGHVATIQPVGAKARIDTPAWSTKNPDKWRVSSCVAVARALTRMPKERLCKALATWCASAEAKLLLSMD